CVGDAVCHISVCTTAMPCTDDAFEPNDAHDEATDLRAAVALHRGPVAAAICRDDVDHYRFTLDPGLRGGQAPPSTLLVALEIARTDVGIAPLQVRVHGAGGTVESEPDYRNIRLTLDG